MADKKKCWKCGDLYTPTEEESDQCHICTECFEMMEESLFPNQDEGHSDADPGL